MSDPLSMSITGKCVAPSARALLAKMLLQAPAPFRGLLPQGVGLNINYPPLSEPAGILITRQGRTVTFADNLIVSFGGDTVTINIGCHKSCTDVPAGTTVPGGITAIGPDETPEFPGADTTWSAQGYITIVPITPDYTADAPSLFPLKID